MSIIQGIKEWISECPGITVKYIGTSGIDGAGVYKQATQTIEELIDGTKLVTANYYILFLQDAQLESEREDSEEMLEAVEDWIDEQEEAGYYPELPEGKHPFEVKVSNGYYMSSREEEKAIYQVTLQLRYRKDGTHD